MEEKCIKTEKVKLRLKDAKALVRRCVELHHWYKCPSCGTFHVSSDNSMNFKTKYKRKKNKP